MRIVTDRRSIEFKDNPEALAAARDAGDRWREAEIAFARALAEVDRGRAYVREGCSSTVQFGARMGFAPEEVRRLLRLGQALTVQPSLEERMRGRAMSASAASVIAPVVSKQATADVLALWAHHAEKMPLQRLRREVRREVAAAQAGEAVVDVTVHVTESVREDFERARIVASRRASRFLTLDETFGAMVDHYLDAFDPMRDAEGTRRVGPTADAPGDRYVPVSSRRAVRRRAGDRCEHPHCQNRTFLEFAHRTPHREGSGREEDDLFLLCRSHHAMYDAGCLTVIGPTADPVWIESFHHGCAYSRDRPGGYEPASDAEQAALEEMRAAERRAAASRRREAAGATDAAVLAGADPRAPP